MGMLINPFVFAAAAPYFAGGGLAVNPATSYGEGVGSYWTGYTTNVGSADLITEWIWTAPSGAFSQAFHGGTSGLTTTSPLLQEPGYWTVTSNVKYNPTSTLLSTGTAVVNVIAYFGDGTLTPSSSTTGGSPVIITRSGYTTSIPDSDIYVEWLWVPPSGSGGIAYSGYGTDMLSFTTGTFDKSGTWTFTCKVYRGSTMQLLETASTTVTATI